jgi:DNA-binding transcriptional ArsR family regulator
MTAFRSSTCCRVTVCWAAAGERRPASKSVAAAVMRIMLRSSVAALLAAGLIYILAKAKLAIMNIKELRSRAGEAASFLKSIANERRLIILCELVNGECTVGELEAIVGLSQSALSQHLARLRDAGLVRARRESQTIHYSLADSSVGEVIGALQGVYCRPAHRR